MLHARPKALFSRTFLIRDDSGAEIAVLQAALLKEGATLQHGGKSYRIEREQLLSGPWRLLDGDEVLFEVVKPSALKNRFELNVRGAWLDFSPTSWLLRGFSLVGPDWAALGGIRRPSWLSRKVEIDLDERVPVLAQLLLLFCGLLIWQRAANSGGGGG